MENVKEIMSEYCLKRARNSEHYEANKELIAAITTEFTDAFGISHLRKTWVDLFAREEESYNTNVAYENTPKIQELDRLRERQFIFIGKIIELMTCSIKEEEKAAAKRLSFVMKPFKRSHRKPYAYTSAEFTVFVQRFRKPENAADVSLLRLGPELDRLDQMNEEFKDIYHERIMLEYKRHIAEKMKDIRPKTDDAFHELVLMINALYRINKLVEHDEAKAEQINKVIDDVNAILLCLQRTLSQAGLMDSPNLGTDPENSHSEAQNLPQNTTIRKKEDKKAKKNSNSQEAQPS